MRYELFLRRDAALRPDEIERIVGEVRQRSAELVVEPYRRDEQLLGIDIGLPLGAPGGGRALAAAAFRTAADHGLSVLDPQLGRRVSPADTAAITTRYDETALFREAALGAPPPNMRAVAVPSTRLWLVVLVLFAAVLLMGRLLQCAA